MSRKNSNKDNGGQTTAQGTRLPNVAGIVAKLIKLGFKEARAVGKTGIAGVSIGGFESRGLCPYTELPSSGKTKVDWQTPHRLETYVD